MLSLPPTTRTTLAETLGGIEVLLNWQMQLVRAAARTLRQSPSADPLTDGRRASRRHRCAHTPRKKRSNK